MMVELLLTDTGRRIAIDAAQTRPLPNLKPGVGPCGAKRQGLPESLVPPRPVC